MSAHHLRAALWQIPTQVINNRSVEQDRLALSVFDDLTVVDRIGMLKTQLDTARGKFAAMTPPAKDDSTSKLDMFVVPEHFFTEDRTHHFVSEATKETILGELLHYSSQYPSLVIVPGTIAWKKAAADHVKGNFFSKKDSGDRAMAKQQSSQKKTQKTVYHDLHKDAVTQLKELRKSGEPYYLGYNTSYIIHRGKVVLKYHKRNNGGEVFQAQDGKDVVWLPGRTDSYFEVGDVTFGIQICAEFSASSLDRAVDIHVMIAASNKIDTTKAKVKENGYLMYCDSFQNPEIYAFPKGSTGDLVPPTFSAAYSPISSSEIDTRVDRIRQINPKSTPDVLATTRTRLGGQLNYYNLVLG